jgi:gliding motility-associated-like protein
VALPTTSNNSITGTWSPTVNNLGTTTYTFTPTAGQCATTATMTITVTPNVTPTFTQVGPICSGATLAALPTTSNNGITGTWSPAVNNLATTPYTFTPTAGQCVTTATMTITVNPNVTPAFTQVGPICSGDALAALPITSNNGITGTWSPAVNNLATTPYTFTPTAGQCVTTATVTMTITVNLIPDTPVLISDGDYFCSLPSPTIAELSNNINGTPTMVWYDASIGGSIYNNTDLLIDGQTYYGSSLSVDGCESNRIAVTVSVCSEVVIPDGFSPNNDGINDTFGIENLAILFPNFKLEIFNRYGNLVFKGTASNPSWDGKASGGGVNLGENILPVGVYFYILDFKNNTRKPIQGRLYLSR